MLLPLPPPLLFHSSLSNEDEEAEEFAVEDLATSLCNEIENDGISYDDGPDGPFICCEYCPGFKYFLKRALNNLRYNVFLHIGWTQLVANKRKRDAEIKPAI